MASSGLEVSPSPLAAGAPDPTPPRSWRDFFLGSDTPPPPATRAEVEADRTLKPGAVLGKDWEILGPLGSGGMSDVFLAFNRRDHRRYALKVLAEKHRDNPSEVARFELEYLALTRVRHESIVVPFVAGCEGGIPYYAMELLEGESLERAFTRQRLSSLDAARVGLAVGQALTKVHAAGIIHRDLKPANVFLVKGGGVKLLDLGIAKLLPAFYADIEQRLPPEARPRTGPGVYLGTQGYMAPEVVQGAEAAPAQDIYGLAVTLCRAITGGFPYHSIIPPGPGDEPKLEVESGEPMHPALEDVLRRALAARAEHRQESMAELCAELTLAIGEMERELIAGPVVEGPAPASVKQPAASSARRARPRPLPPRRPRRGLPLSELTLRGLILAGVFAVLGVGILEGIRSERATQSGLRTAARFADAVTRAVAHPPAISTARAGASTNPASEAAAVSTGDEHDADVEPTPQVDVADAELPAAVATASEPRPRRRGLTRGAFGETIAPHRAALERCVRDIPGASVLEVEADITASGDLDGVRLSPSTYIATRCVDRILRGVHFPPTQSRSTHRITLGRAEK